MKREQAIAIYRAGKEPVVEKLCELSAKVDAQAKKIAVLQKNFDEFQQAPLVGYHQGGEDENG